MALRGTNQEFGRPYNRRIVLETIRLHAPIARAEIARRVGLTVQTVATIIRELEEQGFIVCGRDEPKGRGYPAGDARASIPRAASPSASTSRRSASKPALINLAGDVIGRARRDRRRVDPDTAFREIEAMVAELAALRPSGRMLGVGMAMPGPFGVESMSFVGPTTLEGWKDVPVRERLADADRAAGLRRGRHRRGGPRRAALRRRRAISATSTISISASASAAAWSMTARRCAAPAAMPARSATCRSCRTASPAPAAIAAASNAICRSRRWERRARRSARTRWIAEAAPLFRTALDHHREPVRPRDHRDRRALRRTGCSSGSPKPPRPCPTRSPRGATAARRG